MAQIEDYGVDPADPEEDATVWQGRSGGFFIWQRAITVDEWEKVTYMKPDVIDVSAQLVEDDPSKLLEDGTDGAST